MQTAGIFVPSDEVIFVIVISGIIGTAIMSLFMYLLTYFAKNVMPISQILGTMITCQTTERGEIATGFTAKLVGIIGHYMIGILFAYLYYLLWSYGVGQPDFLNGVILGLVSGGFAVIFWSAFLRIHPFPPHVDLKSYMISLFLAHFVFASTTVAVYAFLTN